MLRQVVINICNMACSDRAVTPDAAAAEADPDEEPLPGLPGAGPAVDGADRPLSPEAVARGGAEAALKSFAESFGNALLEGLPKLWEFLALPLIGFQAGEGVGPQLLINAMQVRPLRSACGGLHGWHLLRQIKYPDDAAA